jgi:hypothetical protein
MLKLDHTRLSDYDFTEDMIFKVNLKQRDNEQGYRLSYEVTAPYALLAYGKALNKADQDDPKRDWTVDSVFVLDTLENHLKELKKHQKD